MTDRTKPLTDDEITELWRSYEHGRDDGEDEDLTLWDVADVYRMGYETLRVMPSLLAELRSRRAADSTLTGVGLTEEDREALRWLQTQARAIQYDRVKAGSDCFPNPARALALLDRLVRQ